MVWLLILGAIILFILFLIFAEKRLAKKNRPEILIPKRARIIFTLLTFNASKMRHRLIKDCFGEEYISWEEEFQKIPEEAMVYNYFIIQDILEREATLEDKEINPEEINQVLRIVKSKIANMCYKTNFTERLREYVNSKEPLDKAVKNIAKAIKSESRFPKIPKSKAGIDELTTLLDEKVVLKAITDIIWESDKKESKNLETTMSIFFAPAIKLDRLIAKTSYLLKK